MKLSIFLFKFLLIGALFIVSNENLYMNNVEDRQEFFSLYNQWFATLFQQIGDITGYVVNNEWLPSNSTVSPKGFDLLRGG